MPSPISFSTSELQTRIMFGIPLNDQDGKPFPDDLFQSYLDSAIAWAEQSLGIAVVPRAEEEFHDWISNDYFNWAYLKLWRKPILQINSLDLYYGPTKMFTIPSDWIKVDPLAGTLQIFPYVGSAGAMGLIINNQGSLWIPILGGSVGYAPQMWHVDYQAGMNEPEGQVFQRTDCHPNLKEVIYKRAAIGILQVWGDLIIGAGISAMSMSIDGAMQSIDTTQSAEYGGASARIKQLEDDINKMMPVLRSYYDGINMVVI